MKDRHLMELVMPICAAAAVLVFALLAIGARMEANALRLDLRMLRNRVEDIETMDRERFRRIYTAAYRAGRQDATNDTAHAAVEALPCEIIPTTPKE